MKLKITDPNGVVYNGQTLAKGTEVEVSGPHADAWLRFKQAQKVPEKTGKGSGK
ncbi:hypothetical protein [Actomonas aquatica]|uniref:Uncharacterized protein n=1 Tax=Actomonas aquatica TaxID=2866162 RepID=A0ABZ1CD43_9BACT|nr:hypothetical protein [Opitutus sp. WL0086]WRQ89403.1 hypothetical protein K1X11_008275 [Opitutus sp. WL0086]